MLFFMVLLFFISTISYRVIIYFPFCVGFGIGVHPHPDLNRYRFYVHSHFIGVCVHPHPHPQVGVMGDPIHESVTVNDIVSYC